MEMSAEEGSSPYIRVCGASDIDALQEIGKETYFETFIRFASPQVMERYLVEAFDREKLIQEMNCPGSKFYFLMQNNELLGYLKLNEAPCQSDLNDAESLEIERIYVRKRYQGRGLGKMLMKHATERARGLKKCRVWLGVWEKNKEAIEFYQKMGFEEAGAHVFRMGEEEQRDYIMKNELC